MAVDFMVMPLSRYISGDFITPQMQFAWSQGIPYAILGPDGRRECPAGVPFGGPDAPARRQQIVAMLLDDLRGLSPAVAARLWDEGTAVEPRFHRVDPGSYEALLAEAKQIGASEVKFFLGLFKRRGSPSPGPGAHVGTTLLLPCEFAVPVMMQSPFQRLT